MIATLVPGMLYAVGGAIPSSIPVSWISAGLGGWMPVQCYVLRDGAESLVLDSGLAVHRAAIEAGLQQVLPGTKPPRALAGRWEPDAMVNLPWLIERFGVREVLSYGGINPLDFFERFELAAAAAQIARAAGNARLVPIEPGQVIPVGRLRLEVIAPSLRLLLTSWFYEHETGTLFTEDSFGLLPNPAAPAPLAVHPDAGALTVDTLAHAFRAKFDWLIGADVESIVADLQSLFRDRPVTRICPGFGAVIEGEDSIARLLHATCSALRRLAAERPASPLAGFDWRHARSQDAVVDLATPSRIPLGIGTGA